MSFARFLVVTLSSIVTVLSFAADYPSGPDQRLTPGALCERADELRYPEKIAYCKRAVTSDTKRMVIERYDRDLGYRVKQMNRADFKIDHYIPLCAGGANSEENLWPQHKTIYEKTDLLEFELCESMKAGRLKQIEVIEIITRAKARPDTARHELDDLKKLRR
jgi:hypothetical protein